MKRNHKDYDLSRYNLKRAAASLDRYFSASFFRYSFVRRFITQFDDVLEIGCGFDKPMLNLLTGGPAAGVGTYLGVDMCPLKQSNNIRISFKGEFNFVEKWQKLLRPEPDKYDIIIHLEVIEHMHSRFGPELLHGCYELLRPNGRMLMSTPCFDGKKQSSNHVYEYTVEELYKLVEDAGFTVKRRFGTKMHLKHLNSCAGLDQTTADAVLIVKDYLRRYFDNNALSCFFAPMFPDYADDNLWECEKS